ncbi:hypothetical protein GQ43DRAFT_465078 [Delitschia confertaspora ATCC 74209]|uniref:A to I editase domain-containing protein n=1 Tax=Delitschia confertaspora ATCC 74209 TaxID=1513339 RepID=A0A9P4JGS2_9PLEO|nr:hypothetical protein GQ43DRAFT_465078 [Delitschia confertaspora ATCC 74209]
MGSLERHCPIQGKDGQLTCVSLGTGMKCLPSSKIPLANGTVLHDWHAEILALRAFNRFLVDECLRLVSDPPCPSHFIRQRSPHEITPHEYQLFAIKDDVEIHMYCSEAPCGDASMELVMAAQEDPTPWTATPPSIPSSTTEAEKGLYLLRGRGHFSHLGAVRLKPSRPDAPPTLSKSCTDKLAMAQVTSALSSLTSLLFTPKNAYISSLVLPKSQYVPTATTRAFATTGRMSEASSVLAQTVGAQDSGYAFHPFSIQTTHLEFTHSRRNIPPTHKPLPSNLSAVYTPHFQETLIGGVLQGRKQFDPRGASLICRKSMWSAVAGIAALAGMPVLVEALKGVSYRDVKRASILEVRRDAKNEVKKRVLKGWMDNEGDGEFGFDGDGRV